MPELAHVDNDIGYYPYGHPTLRQALADRYTARGVPTRPEQVLVTNGGQQALSLLAHALVSPGDQVIVEAPTYPGALEVFREEGAVLRGLPVGLDGLEAAVRERRPTLAYQNPTGSVLSALGRQRLAGVSVPLIEDEVPADLAFPGEPAVTPMAAYGDAVISIGSLSKSVWGGLRIGWGRATPPLINRLARLRAVHDHLHSQLTEALPTWHVPPVTGGQCLWVRLPYGDGNSFAQTALRHGLAVLPGAGLDITGASNSHLRLHFRARPADLTEAVRRLTTAWHTYRPPAVPTHRRPSIAI
ncbi:aminotransferase-like domain-containing protein [Kribbella sp. WER1]